MNPNQVIDVVRELNEKIEIESECSSTTFVLELCTNGIESVVRFLDITLWSSGDDCREFDESKNDFEPLSEYLIKEMNIAIDNLNFQRLKLK
jgi:hypothetical protein